MAFLLAFYEEHVNGATFRVRRGEEPAAVEMEVHGKDLTTGELVRAAAATCSSGGSARTSDSSGRHDQSPRSF